MRRAGPPADADAIGQVLALAYPDRIAQRQKGGEPARYVMSNGRGALFTQPDTLTAEPYLVIAELDAGSQWARIDLAAPIAQKDVERLYQSEIVESEAVAWDNRAGAGRGASRGAGSAGARRRRRVSVASSPSDCVPGRCWSTA